MQFEFYDQTVVVTGGTRGIGRAIAESFLAVGADVVCLYGGNEKAAEQMRADHESSGGLRIVRLDVSDPAAVHDFWRGLEADQVVPQVLVNNAGIRRDNVLAMMPQEDWERVMDVNLGGVFTMCKYAVQAMSGRRYGRIVNITSPSGQIGFEGQANYAASKAGMVALSKSLSKEVARRSITVNCVSPGFIDTEFIQDLPEEQAKRYKQMVPLRRFGKAQEVADAVLFLASREAAYISGAVLDVTGGL